MPTKNVEMTENVEIPDWALYYLICGDASDLTEEDKEQVDKWLASWEGTVDVCPQDDESYFSSSPEFGLACNVVKCNVLVEKGV